MRSLSLTFRRALFAQESGLYPIFLLTITHPDLASPIYLTSDPTQRLSTTPLVYGTGSRATAYLYVGMRLLLPDEKDRAAPQTKLVISNVDRSIIPLVRSISSPASVKIEAVLSSDLDTVEFDVPALDMSAVEFNANEISFDLTLDTLVSEPFPAGSFDPASFPGLFS